MQANEAVWLAEVDGHNGKFQLDNLKAKRLAFLDSVFQVHRLFHRPIWNGGRLC